MTYKLGINTGFAVNRYPELDELIYIIKKKIGLRYIQFTADLLNPSLPRDVFNKQTKILKKACEKYDVEVISCFTGAFTRVNHFSHPNKEIRDYWKDWFKIFVDLASNLKCNNIGSHLGIMSVTDCKNKYLRDERLKNNIECWHDIAKYGKKKGLKKILWEPMSIKREYGETLKECKLIQKKLNNNSPLDFRICLDVDHGDLMSKNKDDINPYKWIEEFANESSMIHLKQSLKNQFGHWPFIKKYNLNGKINPKKIVNKFKGKNIKDFYFIFELSFKEREPHDTNVLKEIRESVNYWVKEVPVISI
jgi:D-erythrulose 1-phosphate 3-epimerase